MNEMKTRGEFYALKLDISKYFYTIDHNVLKDMLKKDMKNEKEYQFLCYIIDSTNRPYINHRIQSLKEKELKTTKRKKEVEKIPFYEYNKGLPIGNMTSQFLSIYYLHELDHKIVHNFKIKHYVRYMDDFILLSRDKKKLEQVRDEIERILNEKYKLTLNHKKTKIISSKEGFSFCGYRFRVIDNKTILTVCKESEMRIKKRIKEVSSLYQKKKLTFEQAFSSINTYYYGFKFGSKKRIRRAVDRYFFKG